MHSDVLLALCPSHVVHVLQKAGGLNRMLQWNLPVVGGLTGEGKGDLSGFIIASLEWIQHPIRQNLPVLSLSYVNLPRLNLLSRIFYPLSQVKIPWCISESWHADRADLAGPGVLRPRFSLSSPATRLITTKAARHKTW